MVVVGIDGVTGGDVVETELIILLNCDGILLLKLLFISLLFPIIAMEFGIGVVV